MFNAELGSCKDVLVQACKYGTVTGLCLMQSHCTSQCMSGIETQKFTAKSKSDTICINLSCIAAVEYESSVPRAA